MGGSANDVSVSNLTEEYDGSAWSSGGNLGTARGGPLAACGTQSAGLCFGGDTYGARSAVTEEYDGTSWSAGGNLATATSSLAGAGTQSAGLGIGGHVGSATNATEEYDPGPGSYDELFTASGGL